MGRLTTAKNVQTIILVHKNPHDKTSAFKLKILYLTYLASKAIQKRSALLRRSANSGQMPCCCAHTVHASTTVVTDFGAVRFAMNVGVDLPRNNALSSVQCMTASMIRQCVVETECVGLENVGMGYVTVVESTVLTLPVRMSS